jgi:flagellar biogenesis protein FliO
MTMLIFGLGGQEIIAVILFLLLLIALFGAFIYGIIKLYNYLNSKKEK